VLPLSMTLGTARADGGSENGTRAPVDPAPDSSLVRLSDRCLTCHRIDAIYSHPVEIIPVSPPPADLPLFQGRMTCVTCHEYDVLDSSHGRDSRGRSWLRGRGAPSELCLDCHEASHRTSADLHAVNLARAHLHWPAGNLGPEPRPAAGGQLDPESTSCLTCHDGSVALGVDEHTSSSLMMRTGAIGAGHPVGVEYDDSGSRWSGAPLVPLSRLDSRIRLVGRQVACGSCHSPYSALEADLVMSNFRSALCLSCHDY
jgi:predicted CXXCH cytochrome family protein